MGGWIPEFIPLGTLLIPDKDHLDSLLVEFPFALVLLHVNVGFAAKNAEIGHIRDGPIPQSDGASPFQATHRLTIIDMNGCLDSELPETMTKSSVVKHRQSLLSDCTVPAFSTSILLRRIRHGFVVLNP